LAALPRGKRDHVGGADQRPADFCPVDSGGPVNTRTIAIAALILAVIILLFFVL
jgi:hypothetical protein